MTIAKVPSDPAQMFRLDGRVALVTGASSGLGERFARVLKAAGASVVHTARRHDRLAALSEELGNALWVAGDVTDDSHVYALVEKTAERHGRIDILVNSAGAEARRRFPPASKNGLLAAFIFLWENPLGRCGVATIETKIAWAQRAPMARAGNFKLGSGVRISSGKVSSSWKEVLRRASSPASWPGGRSANIHRMRSQS